MALQQNIILPIGTDLSFKYNDFSICVKNTEETLENAYIKIDNQSGDKNKIFLNVGIYDKKGGVKVLNENFEFAPDVSNSSKNFLTQGYEQLKVSKYPNAIDLLDEGQTA